MSNYQVVLSFNRNFFEKGTWFVELLARWKILKN